MSPRLAIALVLATLAVPPAYALFVYLWQLTDLLALLVRLAGQPAPSGMWVQSAALLLRTVGLAVAMFILGRGVMKAKWRTAILALIGAWGVAAPLLLILIWSRY